MSKHPNEPSWASGVPPYSEEAERAVLGALILDHGCMAEIDELDSNHFYKSGHRKIFDACRYLYKGEGQINLVLLVDRLKAEDDLTLVGGIKYLAGLLDDVTATASIGAYAELVMAKARSRRLIGACSEAIADLFSGGDVDEAVKALQGASVDVMSRSGVGAEKLGLICDREYNRLQGDEDETERDYIRTGIPGADDYLIGLFKQDLIVLAARPSLGKTALALQAVLEQASSNIVCGVVSAEMSKAALGKRALAHASKVEHRNIRLRRLKGSDFGRLAHGMGGLYELPVLVDDRSGMTPLHVRSIARKCQHEFGRVDAVWVDYLQLLGSADAQRKEDNTAQVIAGICKGLKNAAKSLDIPVIALAQLNRKIEERTGWAAEPRLNDLKGSGDIEQDADVVMFLWTKEKDKSIDMLPVELTIAKQRNGPLGRVKLLFDKPMQTFKMRDDRSYDVRSAQAGDTD